MRVFKTLTLYFQQDTGFVRTKNDLFIFRLPSLSGRPSNFPAAAALAEPPGASNKLL